MSANAPRRLRAVVGHSFWGRGGAEAAAMWTIQALTEDFDVTVLTRGGFHLGELNQLAGTSLSKKDLQVQIDQAGVLAGVGALAHAAYYKTAKRIGRNYDLRVTASGVAPWGAPAIHFLSSVTWNDALGSKFHEHLDAARPSLRRRVLANISARIVEHPHAGRPDDIYIANSEWTAQHSRPFCQGSLRVVSPPVVGPGEVAEWPERGNTVLVFGRVAPEKRIEHCISIVEQARGLGCDLALLIAGTADCPQYQRKIERLCEQRSGWASMVPPRLGEEKRKLLSSIKYGLSACSIEAFGISTAEMIASGVIVFAPSQGGQAELIPDTSQLYRSDGDAAAKLAAIARSPELQRSLHIRAMECRSRFSTADYVNNVRSIVESMQKIV